MREYADQVVAYVRRALGVTLEYDSDTLPVLDHYLRSVPAEEPAALALVVATSAAYFGEVIRLRLGGRWELGDDEAAWRLVLPTGLHFSPAGFVTAAIARADLADVDAEIGAPARMMPHLQQALARMGDVTEEEYYSLCGRLDTLEHVHEVLVSVAARMLGDAADDDDGADGAGPDDDDAADGGGAPSELDDELTGPVN